MTVELALALLGAAAFLFLFTLLMEMIVSEAERRK